MLWIHLHAEHHATVNVHNQINIRMQLDKWSMVKGTCIRRVVNNSGWGEVE